MVDVDENLARVLSEQFSGIHSKDNDRRHLISALVKDYDTSGEEISRRNNITLIVGTIMVTSSFLIFANTLVAKAPTRFTPVHSFASVGLYVTWLLALHETAKELDRITYKRIHTIEQVLSRNVGYDFGVHTYILQETRNPDGKTFKWLRLRRSFWGIVLLLLSLAWLILSVKQLGITL
jgi:hypothetical protein